MGTKNDHLGQVIDFAQVLLSYHTDDSLLHFKQVKAYTKILVTQYNRLYPEKAVPDAEIGYILQGAELHDVGKISVADAVLTRRGALTEAEFSQIRQHTVNGAKIIDSMADIYKLGNEREILHNICLSHHERWDGSGYPNGLKGDEIPLEAQLVSVAEVYAALTEENYADPMTHAQAMDTILSGKCGAFNPVMIECLRMADSAMEDMLSVSANAKRMSLLENIDFPSFHSYWKVKRFFGIMFALIMLIVLFPLCAVLAVLTLLNNPKGGVIGGETRYGRHRKPFELYRFAVKPESGFGRFMRAARLDNLPQLLNILKGDIAFVGPRPARPEEVREYNRYHEIRMGVTPGLTSPQLLASSADTDFEARMDMDIAYIASRTVPRDFLIALKTIPYLIRTRGTFDR